jgi:hypothetical protein
MSFLLKKSVEERINFQIKIINAKILNLIMTFEFKLITVPMTLSYLTLTFALNYNIYDYFELFFRE